MSPSTPTFIFRILSDLSSSVKEMSRALSLGVNVPCAVGCNCEFVDGHRTVSQTISRLSFSFRYIRPRSLSDGRSSSFEIVTK